MQDKVIDNMVIMDRQDYARFKADLHHSLDIRPDIRDRFSSKYETVLVLNSAINYMGEDSYGAVLRILMDRNRSVTPLYKDMGAIFRWAGWQNGKKELLKPPVFDKKKISEGAENPFDESIMHYARCMFRMPGKLEIIVEKSDETTAARNSLKQKSPTFADYFAAAAAGLKHSADAAKSIANAGYCAVSSAADWYKDRNKLKNMTPEQADQYRKEKLDERQKKIESEIADLGSLSTRGKVISIFNHASGEAVMTKELFRHHEMRWTSLVPELLYSTVRYYIEQSPSLKLILEAKVADMVNQALKAKKRAI